MPGVDAIIVADAGVLMVAREVIPNMEIHWSTQANNTNYNSAKFWYKQGAKRVVTARGIYLLKKFVKSGMKFQKIWILNLLFMERCISYSGRCLISNYMTGRDANRGSCAHPCRWKYALVEESRPGEYFPIEEDDNIFFQLKGSLHD